MGSEIPPVKDSPEDDEPDVVGTPEGDNEFAPDEPLKKLPDDAEQVERGGKPDEYRQPKGRSDTAVAHLPRIETNSANIGHVP